MSLSPKFTSGVCGRHSTHSSDCQRDPCRRIGMQRLMLRMKQRRHVHRAFSFTQSRRTQVEGINRGWTSCVSDQSSIVTCCLATLLYSAAVRTTPSNTDNGGKGPYTHLSCRSFSNLICKSCLVGRLWLRRPPFHYQSPLRSDTHLHPHSLSRHSPHQGL